MHLSVIGRKMASLSGLRSIMDDIATTRLGSPGDWINLSVGNPAPIPEVRQFWHGLAREVLEAGDYLAISGSYGPARGMPSLVQAAVRYFNHRYGWGITPENVVVGTGSQMLCFAAAALFTGPGSGRLVLPIAPDYTGYQALCMQPDGVAGVPARLRPDGDHHFSYAFDPFGLERHDDAGLLLVSSPSNPTGRCVDAAEQTALIDLAEKRDVPLILDHAYGQPFPRIAGTLTAPPWHPNVINTFTFSKAGLPGERIGIAIGAERYISPIVSFLANSVLHAPQLAQALAAQALDTGHIDALVSSVITPYYARRRAFAEKLLHDIMPASVDWRVHAGDGGMFCWLWIDEDWCDDLALYESLKQRRVFVVPGRHFFVPPASGVADPHARRCIRISITAEESALAEGIARIADALVALREAATVPPAGATPGQNPATEPDRDRSEDMSESREEFVDTPYEEPATPLEATVASIGAEVLGIDRIGRSDSFYDFGGTSLQAIRICARVERELGYRALPVWLFESDLLSDFVARLVGHGERVHG